MYTQIKKHSVHTKNLLISSRTIDYLGINTAIEYAIIVFIKHFLLYHNYKKIKIFVDGNYSFRYETLSKEVKNLEEWKIKKKQNFTQIVCKVNSSFYFIDIENITKGDEKVFSIACASIVSKVLRDQFMKNISPLFPQYEFHQNKGYGTKSHINLLKKYGECILHRKSYTKNLQ